MPSKRFDENTKVKAVRLVREHADDSDLEWAASARSRPGWG
jgi:transposase